MCLWNHYWDKTRLEDRQEAAGLFGALEMAKVAGELLGSAVQMLKLPQKN